MSMWSTRSEASMNDIDIFKRRLRMGRRGDGRVVITCEFAGDAASIAGPDRYTLGVGGRRPSTPTPVDDVFRHLSTSVIGGVDGVRPSVRHWPDTDRRAGTSGGRDGQHHPVRNGEGPPLPRALSQAGSHRGGEARLHDDARSEAVPLHGHGVEVEGRVHRSRRRRGFRSGCSPTAGCDPSSRRCRSPRTT